MNIVIKLEQVTMTKAHEETFNSTLGSWGYIMQEVKCVLKLQREVTVHTQF